MTEKPGIQAIGNKYPDLIASSGKILPPISVIMKYVRHATISLLAKIDLLTGNCSF